MINFTVTISESEEIHHIAKTFLKYCPEYPDDLMTLEMDITACHANGNPIDLDRLGDAVLDLPSHARYAQDVIHDIYGIRKHINRNTGKLENCFVPRFSKR